MKVFTKIWHITKIEDKKSQTNTFGNTEPPHTTQPEDPLQRCSLDRHTIQDYLNTKSQHMTPSYGSRMHHPKPSKNYIRITRAMYSPTILQQEIKCLFYRNLRLQRFRGAKSFLQEGKGQKARLKKIQEGRSQSTHQLCIIHTCIWLRQRGHR